METQAYETNSQPVHNVRFEGTSDPSIFKVSGLSTDRDLIQVIGAAIERSDVPKGLKYVKFDDDTVLAVIKKRGADEYTTRSPRSPSSNPPAMQDPMAQLRQMDQERAARIAEIKVKLDSDIARREEELSQLKESRSQLDMKH